jgi:hypothetical protein
MAAPAPTIALAMLLLFSSAWAANNTTTIKKAVYQYLPKPGTPEAKALLASKNITGERKTGDGGW